MCERTIFIRLFFPFFHIIFHSSHIAIVDGENKKLTMKKEKLNKSIWTNFVCVCVFLFIFCMCVSFFCGWLLKCLFSFLRPLACVWISLCGEWNVLYFFFDHLVFDFSPLNYVRVCAVSLFYFVYCQLLRVPTVYKVQKSFDLFERKSIAREEIFKSARKERKTREIVTLCENVKLKTWKKWNSVDCIKLSSMITTQNRLAAATMSTSNLKSGTDFSIAAIMARDELSRESSEYSIS